MTMRKRATLLVAILAGLLAVPAVASGQRPLVYCPIGIDETGCGAIINALGDADRAYDGSMGTIDLRTADLGGFSVLIIPSLADYGTTQPYALLRDPQIGDRLRGLLLGRHAFWSGTPDLGSASRAEKDALIRRLAGWAGGNHDLVRAPGLLVLQDRSADIGQRYSWVEALTGARVVADPALYTYAAVRTLTAIGIQLVDGASYANMASLGFFLPSGASGISLDAVGQTGTSVGGQVVLMTSSGGNTGGAIVRTDRDDYAPGETVRIEGSGWQPGELITLTLAEDPEVHEERSFRAIADGAGVFAFTGFAPEEHDLYVRFILTATGESSDLRAQTTFTDGPNPAVAFEPQLRSGSPADNCSTVVLPTLLTPVCVRMTATNPGNERSDVDFWLQWVRPDGTIARARRMNAPVPPAPASPSVALTDVLSGDLLTMRGTWNVLACKGHYPRDPHTVPCRGGLLNGDQLASITFLIGGLSVSPATGTYGGTTTTALTATFNDGGGKLITFALNGTMVGSATTNADGVATLSDVTSLSGIAAGAYPAGVTATFAGDGSHTAADATAQLTVNPAVLTVTADNQSREYGEANPPFTGTLAGVIAGDNITATFVAGSGGLVGPASPAANYAITPVLNDPDGRLVNYTVASTSGTLTITRAVLTVTTEDRSRAYGEPNPAFTGSVAGQKNLDNISATWTTAATLSSPPGPYAIEPVLVDPDGKLGNYTVQASNGTLTIGKAQLTITGPTKQREYGAENPSLDGSFSGAKNGESFMVSGTTDAVATSPIGDYPIVPSASGATLGNYELVVVNGTLTVTKARLTITASNRTKTYGEEVVFDGTEFTTAGLVGTDAVNSVTLSSTGAVATASIAGSPYPIVATDAVGSGLGNYTIGYAPGTLSVTKPKLTIVGPTRARVYGEPNPSLDGTFSGAKNGESFTVSGTTAAMATSPIGDYPIVPSASGATLGNYDVVVENGTLTVTKAKLTITASNRTKTYGDQVVFAGTEFTTAGLVNADAVNSVTLSSEGAAATATVAGSPYPIAATDAVGTGLGNYTIGYAPGTLTVSPKALTITASDRTKTYGEQVVFAGTEFTTAGLVNTDAVNSVTLSSAGATATATVAGSPYPIVATDAVGSGLGNYTIGYAPGTLTVNQKALTITAKDQSRQYSDPNPQFAATYYGYVLDENENVLSGAMSCTTTATTATAPGTEPINCWGEAAGNYAITYRPGTLTITKEDMQVEQTGVTFFTTGSVGGSTTAAVSALVSETDSDRGVRPWNSADVNLKVRFTAYTGLAATSTDKWCEAAVPNGAATGGSAVATCTIAGLTESIYQLEIRLLPNPYYVEATSTGALTVTDPGTGFSTGGGWFDDGNTGQRSNFGFTAKILKNGQLQGNSVLVYRRSADLGGGRATATITTTSGKKTITQTVNAPDGVREYDFVVKSNSMGTLRQLCSDNLGNEPCWSTFSGGLNVRAVDRRTGTAYTLTAGYMGNQASFQIDVTDNGEPGARTALTPDQYAITVTTSNGIFYQVGSPRTSLGPANGTQVNLKGGNIQVRLKR